MTCGSPLAQKILDWYAIHQRTLPWRHTGDAPSCLYRILVSETMLQQTTVQTVIPFFHRFMERFPSVHHLAQATEQEVLYLWQGLGYYRRAFMLHKAAQQWAERGAPTTYDECLRLPGVGPYTAGALTTIGLNQPAAAVDGNIRRVFARYFGLETSTWKKDVEVLAQQHLPSYGWGDYTQGLMDLGATVCRPRTPSCHLCPLQDTCTAFKTQKMDFLPLKEVKTRPYKFGHVYLLYEPTASLKIGQNPYWVTQEKEKKLLHGLWGFPTSAWQEGEFPDMPWDHLMFVGEVSHVFTHFHLHLQIWHGLRKDNLLKNLSLYDAIPLDQCLHRPFSTLMRKVLRVFTSLHEKTS